ncbi:MAG: GNAT family N-acetyltransferase [Fimbriimonas sp.]|nr:GNAT family N-acetyltransferase [Fimbriimonas sp.]
METDAKLRTADESELPALLELWTAVLNPDVSVFTSMYYSCPAVKRRTFVMEDHGKIVSSVQQFILPVRDELCKAVPIGAIANVSTLPEYRGRGYSTKLLHASISDMKAAGCGWSYLFTGIMPFYERLGWRPIHRTSLAVSVRSKPEADAFTDVVIDETPDLERLRMLDEGSFVAPLSQIRGDLDWKYKIPPRILGKTVFVGEDSFAIVHRSDDEATIEEWGMPDPSVIKFQHLVESVAGWTFDQGIQRMVVSAPILAEARQALETIFATVDEIDHLGAMVRPLSSRWPLSRIISLFSLQEARFLTLDNF